MERELIKQLRTHFTQHRLDVKKLREFIETNRILETSVADNSDINKTTLRQHLLLTEQTLNLLLQLPQPKHLDKWIETKTVQEFLRKNLEPIPRLSITCTPVHDIKVNQQVRNAVEFAIGNGWDEKRIALEFGATIREVKELIAETVL